MHKHQIIQAILQDVCKAQRDATTAHSIARQEWLRKGMPDGEEPGFDEYWAKCLKIESDGVEAIMEATE